jgi:hypothetical protein
MLINFCTGALEKSNHSTRSSVITSRLLCSASSLSGSLVLTGSTAGKLETVLQGINLICVILFNISQFGHLANAFSKNI